VERNGSGGSPRDGSSCGPSSMKPRYGGRSGARRYCATSFAICSASAAARTSRCRLLRSAWGVTWRRAGSASCGSANRSCPTSPTWNTSPVLCTSTRNPMWIVTCWPWSGSAWSAPSPARRLRSSPPRRTSPRVYARRMGRLRRRGQGRRLRL